MSAFFCALFSKITSPNPYSSSDVLRVKASIMMKLVYSLLLFSMLISCTDDNNQSSDELILGISFGECGGDCAHFFKLEDNKLYRDDEEEYWWRGPDGLDFMDESIGNDAALTEINNLKTNFPTFLTETNEDRFGCPDCADGGAIHVMRRVDGEEQWWTLDNDVSKNPEALQEWTRGVQEFLFKWIN